MTDVLISLGANLGNTRGAINTAAAMLQERFGADQVSLSSLLVTPPIGGPTGQSDFLNAVAKISTSKDIFQVWHELREIESTLGRQRRTRWESRRIDLDILMVEDMRVWTPHLKIPHPRMVTRSFATLPAAELLPDAIEPVSGLSLQQLADRLPYQYDPSTATLHKFPILPPNTPQDILVACSDSQVAISMENAWKITRIITTDITANRFQVTFAALKSEGPSTQNVHRIESLLRTQRLALLVIAVDCPDPINIAWEDYSRPWAVALGMFADNSESSAFAEARCVRRKDWNFPKYLLNAFDVDWAVHELNAAIASMRCEMSFAKPGFELPRFHSDSEDLKDLM